MPEPESTVDQDESVADALVRVTRAIDPTLELHAVRRFWSEIDEMEQALPELDAETAPLPSGYSPLWSDGQLP